MTTREGAAPFGTRRPIGVFPTTWPVLSAYVLYFLIFIVRRRSRVVRRRFGPFCASCWKRGSKNARNAVVCGWFDATIFPGERERLTENSRMCKHTDGRTLKRGRKRDVITTSVRTIRARPIHWSEKRSAAVDAAAAAARSPSFIEVGRDGVQPACSSTGYTHSSRRP